MIVNIKNQKRKFSTDARIYSTVSSQIKGLMFTRKLKNNESILLKFKEEKNIPIHMFFVFYPIDAVWINKSGSIVHIARNIRPFTPLVNPRKRALAILETAKNITSNLKLGDKLHINSGKF
ncbi:MAG: DUF192 domain-containing protein [Nanoarchaeota archaeon]|nr:DUF192 domain-containing protein [Nanoarchaeota archaeon]